MRGCFFTGRHYVNIGIFIYIIPYGMIIDIGGRIFHLLFKVQTMDFSDIEVLRKETLITCTYLLEEEKPLIFVSSRIRQAGTNVYTLLRAV